MSRELVKHILVDNGSDLPATLAFNFEISRASVGYGFQKF